MKRNLMHPYESARFVRPNSMLFSVVMLSGLLVTGIALSPSAVALDDDSSLAFRKDGQEIFDQALAAFEARSFKEAYDGFKSARKQAKDRSTKIEVDRWILGTKGANELTALQKQADLGKQVAAHRMASNNLKKYEGTPIEEEYSKFVEELERELFTMLESFDNVSKRYSEKYGKTFKDAPEMVKQGRRSLQWEVDRKNYELKVKSLPSSMGVYSKGALIFWMHFGKGGSNYKVIFKAPGKSSSSSGDAFDNAFYVDLKKHNGWKRGEVPLKSFTKQGEVDWSSVRDLRIQFVGGRKFTCHVDAIMLRK